MTNASAFMPEERTVLSTDLVNVPAGSRLVVDAVPQVFFRPSYCVVTTPRRKDFAILNITIGSRAQFPSCSEILATAFAPQPCFDGCEVAADFEARLTAFVRQVQAFDFDTLQANQPLTVCVENRSDLDGEFQMAFWGVTAYHQDGHSLVRYAFGGGAGEEGCGPGATPAESYLTTSGPRIDVNARKVAVLRDMLDREVTKKP